MHAAGFSERLLDPSEELELLPLGFGLTNVVARATAAADELSNQELIDGGNTLQIKVKHFAPRFLAILGIGAYRTAFGRPKAKLGLQPEVLGTTRVWVLPSPSGLNAYYNHTLVTLYHELLVFVRSGNGAEAEPVMCRD
jgi:TDG/mug DNA glycosylase family protein